MAKPIQYLHKKTGFKATMLPNTDNARSYQIDSKGYGTFIPASIVEDSSDWEPINDFLFTTFDRIEIRDPSDRVYRVNPDGTKGFIPASDALKEVSEKLWDGVTRYYRNAYSADEYAQTLRKPAVLFVTEDGASIIDPAQIIYTIRIKPDHNDSSYWKASEYKASDLISVANAVNKEYLLYVTKGTRDNYMMWHKPLLSLTEAMKCATDAIGNSATRNKVLGKIRAAINSKLK